MPLASVSETRLSRNERDVEEVRRVCFRNDGVIVGHHLEDPISLPRPLVFIPLAVEMIDDCFT